MKKGSSFCLAALLGGLAGSAFADTVVIQATTTQSSFTNGDITRVEVGGEVSGDAVVTAPHSEASGNFFASDWVEAQGGGLTSAKGFASGGLKLSAGEVETPQSHQDTAWGTGFVTESAIASTIQGVTMAEVGGDVSLRAFTIAPPQTQTDPVAEAFAKNSAFSQDFGPLGSSSATGMSEVLVSADQLILP